MHTVGGNHEPSLPQAQENRWKHPMLAFSPAAPPW
jgi:hypothetical protein